MTITPSPSIRQAVLCFPDNAPRGAVIKFCAEHNVSRSWFYKIRHRARTEGADAARLPRSHATHTKTSKTPVLVETIALRIRQELKDNGWDYGPLSVWDVMDARGLNPPSRATLARIFTRNNAIKPQPKKRPRSSYKSFTAARPNESWQLDGTEYTIGDDSTWVVLQIEDDHSRKILASITAPSETGNAAIEVFNKAAAGHGIPQRFHTDNSTAFNRDRWGITTRFAAHLRRFGVEPVTGKPGKPTTQGKQERLHQTLQRFLDVHQPIPDQTRLNELINQFDYYYNTIRRHQAHQPRRTPDEAYYGTPKATPPTPPEQPTRKPAPRPTRSVERVVYQGGSICVTGCEIYVGTDRKGQTLRVVHDYHTITIIDPETGEILGQVTRPPGINQKHLLSLRRRPNRPQT